MQETALTNAAAKSAAPTVFVDTIVESEAWHTLADCEDVVARAIAAAAALEGTAAGEVAVLLTDDERIRVMNRDFRGFDKPTNVLSFPAAAHGHTPDAPPMLGDIAIAFETVRREAAAEGKTMANHLSHLAVHGFLHLTGHDHEEDEEAARMEERERTILASLGIADPYADAGERP